MRKLLVAVVLIVAVTLSGCIGALSAAHTALNALYVAHTVEGIRMMISAREIANADGTVERPSFGTGEKERAQVEQAIARSCEAGATKTVKGYRCQFFVNKQTKEINTVKVFKANRLMYLEADNDEVISVLWRSASFSSKEAGEVKDGLDSKLGKK